MNRQIENIDLNDRLEDILLDVVNEWYFYKKDIMKKSLVGPHDLGALKNRFTDIICHEANYLENYVQHKLNKPMRSCQCVTCYYKENGDRK